VTQTEARELAKQKNALSHVNYVATTLCALRGEHEEGPDANKWVVVIGRTIVEGP